MKQKRDFNRIKQWLDPLLKSKGLSVEKFANKCGITRTAVYFFRADTNRPTEQVMARMCRELGRPFEEGLAQYTPRPNGRPPGIAQATTGARTRGRK